MGNNYKRKSRMEASPEITRKAKNKLSISTLWIFQVSSKVAGVGLITTS